MNRYRQIILVSSVLAVFSFWTQVSASQEKKEGPLRFRALPKKALFKRGEDVILLLSLTNNSNEPIFVSRLNTGEFVDIELKGPNGDEVPWQGRRKIDNKEYDPADFVVLKPGQKITANRIVSLKDGEGFLA